MCRFLSAAWRVKGANELSRVFQWCWMQSCNFRYMDKKCDVLSVKENYWIKLKQIFRKKNATCTQSFFRIRPPVVLAVVFVCSLLYPVSGWTKIARLQTVTNSENRSLLLCVRFIGSSFNAYSGDKTISFPNNTVASDSQHSQQRWVITFELHHVLARPMLCYFSCSYSEVTFLFASVSFIYSWSIRYSKGINR